jgi:hypothetical protein
MAESNNIKEAYYHEYCNKCKYCETSDAEDPCNDCLNQPFNYDTHRPINYKPKEE